MTAEFPPHLLLYQQIAISPVLSVLKLAPLVDKGSRKRQVWYVRPSQVDCDSLHEYCRYHDAEVRKLAARGGIGVLVYDLSQIESVDNWAVTFKQFVETTCALLDPYEKWLKEAIIILSNESSYILLNTIFSTFYSPTRPTRIVMEAEEAMKMLGDIWQEQASHTAVAPK